MKKNKTEKGFGLTLLAGMLKIIFHAGMMNLNSTSNRLPEFVNVKFDPVVKILNSETRKEEAHEDVKTIHFTDPHFRHEK